MKILTYELSFKVAGTDEVKTFTFSNYYNEAEVDEPKDVAIQHCMKLTSFDEFKGLVPWFKTFKILNDRTPSDVGLR